MKYYVKFLCLIFLSSLSVITISAQQNNRVSVLSDPYRCKSRPQRNFPGFLHMLIILLFNFCCCLLKILLLSAFQSRRSLIVIILSLKKENKMLKRHMNLSGKTLNTEKSKRFILSVLSILSGKIKSISA